MRRSPRGEPSSFSLFPFLAVLLCTMGSLVVLLVAMAHVSRDKAKEEAAAAEVAAAAARLAADSPARRALEAQLAEADAALEQMRRVKAEGEERLQNEQKRLSDIEDHLRRLRDETETLTAETAELMAVEGEHYDDEKIAQQEIERLNALIGEIQDEIEELKHAAAGRERKFAIVPLRDGRSGTLRPPVYFECKASGVIMQPEGVELTWTDLVAADFSSPLAAASRAVTRYYEEHPETRAANESGRPYPLLVVRPDGVHSYYQARTALEEVGADYGYQPIAEDWPIEYGEINPVLASQVEEAVRTARAERVGLAKVIPQLNAALSSAERDANLAMTYPAGTSNGAANTGFGSTQNPGKGGGAGGGGLRIRPANPDSNNPFEGLRIDGSLAGEVGDPSNQPSAPVEETTGSEGGPRLLGATPPPAAEGGQGGNAPPTELAGVAATEAGAKPSESTADGVSSAGQRYGAAVAVNDPSEDSTEAPEGQTVQTTTGAKAEAQPQGQASVAASTQSPGAGSTSLNAAKSAPVRDGVPMIRPIRLYVAEDRVVVLPDTAQSPAEAMQASSISQTIEFEGPTTGRINDLIGLLKRHADSWGIAGAGMYWDPRLVLNVASDGSHRADDVRRLLEAAGIKVQAYPVTTAAKPAGAADAPRR
ncbi:hypothetical protein Pla108_19780 [Botrimarina colliarenosi]|uniref:IncA protein n=1 Tax=Botrimarina colliarenosi TaxID=2528001 RepID=A0A5C6AEH6_9BACT|nr:hypothetical protein [Botrimarina colliarenosi]TWT97826.1 hypothetical protein Pla108_19780 [Botrimarina colliarenosi]